MYIHTTLLSAIVGTQPRRFVYVDGKCWQVHPDPFEQWEYEDRDEREDNTRALTLPKARGRMNKIVLESGGKLRFEGWSEEWVQPGDTPVWQFEDVIWMTKEPHVGLKTPPYGRVKLRTMREFAYGAVNGTHPYSVLDGLVVRAVLRTGMGVLGDMTEAEKKVMLGTPDLVTFANIPVHHDGDARPHFLSFTSTTAVHQIGPFWADTSQVRAGILKRTPRLVTNDEPISFD